MLGSFVIKLLPEYLGIEAESRRFSEEKREAGSLSWQLWNIMSTFLSLLPQLRLCFTYFWNIALALL
jgi:hypothetical protein